MEAIVLAGGFGTRLKSIISDIPKPMALIAGKPFLQYILDWLLRNNVQRVILSVGYKWEIIYNEFGKKYKNLDLVYSVEDNPLGTGGAIAMALLHIQNDHFIIINGDTYFNIDLIGLRDFHFTGNYNLSVALKPMHNFSRYGKAEINDLKRITRFYEKELTKEGNINGGIYMTDKAIIKHFPKSVAFSFEKDILETKLDKLNIGGFIRDNYFIDIGIPEDFIRAQIEMINDQNPNPNRKDNLLKK